MCTVQGLVLPAGGEWGEGGGENEDGDVDKDCDEKG